MYRNINWFKESHVVDWCQKMKNYEKNATQYTKYAIFVVILLYYHERDESIYNIEKKIMPQNFKYFFCNSLTLD